MVLRRFGYGNTICGPVSFFFEVQGAGMVCFSMELMDGELSGIAWLCSWVDGWMRGMGSDGAGIL